MTVETKATTDGYMDPAEKKIREMPAGELMTWIEDLVSETCDAKERASILTDIALDKLPNSTDDDESRAVLQAMRAQFSTGDFKILELVWATRALAEKLGAPCEAEVHLGKRTLVKAKPASTDAVEKALSRAAEFVMPSVTYEQLNRKRATAEVVASRAASVSEVQAGARFARSMLHMMHEVQGGEPAGDGDDECRPFDYIAMSRQVQTCIAAAIHDAKSCDFMVGFTMGIAVYLHPGLSGCVLGHDLLTWDPVEELCEAAIC